MDDLGWMAAGACVDTDDVFFPERGTSTAAAKAICAGCPVQATCLTYALDHDLRWGVWGGTSPAERRKILAERTAA